MDVTRCEDAPQWDQYVSQSERASGYHQIGWKQILERTYGLDACYLIARHEGTVAGILPLFVIQSGLRKKALVSLPYLTYGGLCAENPEAEQQLLEVALAIARERRITHLELHHLHRPTVPLDTNEQKITMLLPLDPDPETLWASFPAKVRNQVRKGPKSGLDVRVGRTEFLEDFYEVFAANMRDLGSPVHRKQLFQHTLETFPESTWLFMIYHETEPVGGALAVAFRETLEVPWASSRREYFSASPNNLLYWEILKFACERGFQTFDFGRSTKDSGTFRFKKQWGAEPRQLYWQFRFPQESRKLSSMPDLDHSRWQERLMIETWKRLPVGLTKILGPPIRKHISA